MTSRSRDTGGLLHCLVRGAARTTRLCKASPTPCCDGVRVNAEMQVEAAPEIARRTMPATCAECRRKTRQLIAEARQIAQDSAEVERRFEAEVMRLREAAARGEEKISPRRCPSVACLL